MNEARRSLDRSLREAMVQKITGIKALPLHRNISTVATDQSRA